jgi:hypothetical protein
MPESKDATALLYNAVPKRVGYVSDTYSEELLRFLQLWHKLVDVLRAYPQTL